MKNKDFITMYSINEDNNKFVSTTVVNTPTEFKNYLIGNSKQVVTGEGRRYCFIPYIFEQVNESNIFILRSFDDKHIKKEILDEIKSSIL